MPIESSVVTYNRDKAFAELVAELRAMRRDALNPTAEPVSFDASARQRVGFLTTLADLKCLNVDDPLLLETVGTGTNTFSANKMAMSVTAGQYSVRKSKHYFPYFSGKSQQVEITCDNFHNQAGVVKRIGYFSTNAVAPYNSTLDGFWLEADGTTHRLKMYRAGVEVLNVPAASWNGDPEAKTHNFQNFSVVMFDFLWLGGAVLRVLVKTNDCFKVVHIFHYSGTAQDTFTRSPNHPVRWDIYSSSGSGTLRAICAHAATEGSTFESGKQRSANTGATAIVMATAGTTYPLIAIRKATAQRDRSIKQVGVGAFVASNNDQCLLTLQLNPTLSAALTFSALPNSSAESAVGNGTITVTSPGVILFSMHLSQNQVIPPNILENDFLSNIGVTIADVSDQLTLCITPITASVGTFGVINYKEF
jgi:hypothetical protein